MRDSQVETIPFSDLVLEDFLAAARWHHREQTVPHEEDFIVFRRMDGATEVFVDAGANIGNSVVSFRLMNRTAPIISFEPGFWLEPALRYLHEHDPAMTYHLVGLGERAERMPLYIPSLDRRPDFYLASLFRDRFEGPRLPDSLELMHAKPGQRFALCTVEVRIAPLDDFALSPQILKIDVEDAELQALRGARGTIARSRPLILIEGANRQPEILSFLREIDYRFCTREGDQLRPGDAIATSASNGFYVAAERSAEYHRRGILLDERP